MVHPNHGLRPQELSHPVTFILLKSYNPQHPSFHRLSHSEYLQIFLFLLSDYYMGFRSFNKLSDYYPISTSLPPREAYYL